MLIFRLPRIFFLFLQRRINLTLPWPAQKKKCSLDQEQSGKEMYLFEEYLGLLQPDEKSSVRSDGSDPALEP